MPQQERDNNRSRSTTPRSDYISKLIDFIVFYVFSACLNRMVLMIVAGVRLLEVEIAELHN